MILEARNESYHYKVTDMKSKSTQKGVVIVEFALILPLFVVLTFGVIEFSLMIYDKAIITNASREAARSGIVHNTTPLTSAQLTANTGQIICQIWDKIVYLVRVIN